MIEHTVGKLLLAQFITHMFLRDFAAGSETGPVLELKVCNGAREVKNEVVTAVRRDLDSGLRPEDLLVIAMPRATPTADELAAALRSHGMQALVAGAERNQDLFRCDGHVTVANIFRAKGNEAWKVYACGVHIAGAPFVADPDEELKRRNQVFTALSRARIWCIAIGLSGAIMTELARALEQAPALRFRAFNQRSLRRTYNHKDTPEIGALAPVERIDRIDRGSEEDRAPL